MDNQYRTSYVNIEDHVGVLYSASDNSAINVADCSSLSADHRNLLQQADLPIYSDKDFPDFIHIQDMSRTIPLIIPVVSFTHHAARQYVTAPYSLQFGTYQDDACHLRDTQVEASEFYFDPWLIEAGGSFLGKPWSDNFVREMGIQGAADSQLEHSPPKIHTPSGTTEVIIESPESAASDSTYNTNSMSARSFPVNDNAQAQTPGSQPRLRAARRISVGTTPLQDSRTKLKSQVMKRERNRVSAQHCRQRSRSKLSGLEEQAGQKAADHDILLQCIKDLQYELIATQVACMEQIRCKCPAVKAAMSGHSRKAQQQLPCAGTYIHNVHR